MLKNSARNWRLALSLILWIGKFLKSEKSKLTSPGPRNIPTPALPKPVAAGGQFPSGRTTLGSHVPGGSSPPTIAGEAKQFLLMKLVSFEVVGPTFTYCPG